MMLSKTEPIIVSSVVRLYLQEEDIDAIVHDNNIFEGKGNKVYGFNLKSIPDTTPKCFLNLDGLTVQFQKLVQQTGERCMFCTHFAYMSSSVLKPGISGSLNIIGAYRHISS